MAAAYNGFGAIIMMGADVLVAEGDCCLLVRDTFAGGDISGREELDALVGLVSADRSTA